MSDTSERPVGPGVGPRGELAELVRERLGSALLDALADQLVVEGGDRARRREDLLVVDHFALLTRCPSRLANPADDYVDSIATVRRRLGLLALRHAWSDHGDRSDVAPVGRLAGSVQEVLADRTRWPAGLRDWYVALGRAGQAAVGAAVLTWSTDVARLLGGGDRPTGAPRASAAIRWSDPFMATAADVPGRAIRLKASVDAVLGGRDSGEKLFVVSDAVPGPADRLRAGHLAVVHALASGRTPVRVSIGSPASGRVSRIEVDRALVELTVDRVVEVVGHLTAGDTAPTAVGAWCTHCHLRSDCGPGTAHLERRRDRPGSVLRP